MGLLAAPDVDWSITPEGGRAEVAPGAGFEPSPDPSRS
jgi:hypothetical protein